MAFAWLEPNGTGGNVAGEEMEPGRSSVGSARDGGNGRRSFGIELLLRPFTRVRRSEVVTLLLLTFNVFLLLTGYYILKVVREPLIMTGGGAEVKTYAAAAQAVLLAVIVRFYAALCARFDRIKLIAAITIFFGVNLIVFFVLGRMGVSLGVAFFLWVGMFNVAVISQFWAFANDLYTQEQGERLFAFVAVGSSVGAIVGAQLAGWLLRLLGVFGMMPLAFVILLVYLLLTWVVHRRESRRPARQLTASNDPIGNRALLQLLFKDRYMLAIATLTLLFNWVNTTGEYILDRKLLETAQAMDATAVAHFIGTFRASFFSWVNLVGLLIQLFVVSRLFRYIGLRPSLFVLPVVSFLGYGMMELMPVLSLITAAKLAENSLDYSLAKTARESLFLITSREAKYKVKLAIDTVFWRIGDVAAAIVVFGGSVLALQTKHFIRLNLVLVAAWLAITFVIARLHRTRVPNETA